MTSPPASIAFLLLMAAWSFCADTVRADEAGDLLFEHHVQTIFKSKCGKCHSHEVRKGDLDLSTIVGVRAGGESGESLIGAEKPAEGYLWAMIDGEAMPPEDLTLLAADLTVLVNCWN